MNQEEQWLLDYIDPEYLQTGNKLLHKFAIVGYFTNGDIWIDWIDNESDLSWYLNQIRANGACSNYIIVNYIGQLLYSTYTGYRNMKHPKYFKKYLKEVE
jgi:hypothetical protein